jgi:hypothetical protein
MQLMPWLGLVAFLGWVFNRHRKASRLESENRTLKIVKEVTDDEKRLDDSTLPELVDEFNKRRNGPPKG